jgi:hypothetical protein
VKRDDMIDDEEDRTGTSAYLDTDQPEPDDRDLDLDDLIEGYPTP